MSEVTIVGGGIVGVCAAITLQRQGYSVEIVDRGREREAASFGNCALLAVGEIVPLSRPGVVRNIPKWLLDPEGPLFVRPRAFFSEMPWLMRFLYSGRRSRVVEIAGNIAALTRRAESDVRDLLSHAGIADNLVPAENLLVYNSKADYEGDSFSLDLKKQLGFDHQFLNASEVRKLEPSLGGPVDCGALLKGWLQFSDPGLMLQRLSAFFISQGGKIRIASVDGIVTQGNKVVALRLAGGEQMPVKQLVLAAGAWSGLLARDLGLRLPIAALQGYHHDLPHAKSMLGRAVLYANGGFVITPLETGLRVAGTIEIAGLDPKPNFARADVILRKAKTILPDLDTRGGTQWMGPRPFMPDTTPVIDRAPRHDNAILAFGHGQTGMTLGATTAKIVADLIARRNPRVDLSPYSATRF